MVIERGSNGSPFSSLRPSEYANPLMLVSGVFSSWAARLRKRSLRASRSAAERTAAARAMRGSRGFNTTGISGSKRNTSAPTSPSRPRNGSDTVRAPASARRSGCRLFSVRAARSGAGTPPSLPNSTGPCKPRPKTAAASAPQSDRAMRAMRAASCSVDSPARAASARWVAAPEACQVISSEREKDSVLCSSAGSRSRLASTFAMARPSRSNPSAVPVRATFARAASEDGERASPGGRRARNENSQLTPLDGWARSRSGVPGSDPAQSEHGPARAGL